MINYLLESFEQINKIEANMTSKKPHILLHVCCGACSCFPLLYLIDRFDFTIFFSNSNIYPYEEFNKRLDALKQYVFEIENKFNKKINIIVDQYNYEEFKKDLIPYKNEKEMGKRCDLCIKKRMINLFKYSKTYEIPYVSTVMSVSKNKNSDYINTLGKKLEEEYSSEFIIFDFKKNNGQKFGSLLAEKYKIYRQNYCGCEFSKR